jgi:hypothetical protein
LERTQSLPTLATVKFDILELGEDTTPTSDNTANSYKAVEMRLTQLSKSVVDRQVEDADVNLGMNSFIIRIVQQHNIHSYLIKELKHLCRGVGQEVGKDGLAFCQMLVRDLQRLCVNLTQRPNPVTIDGRARGVNVGSQECLELSLDCPLNRRLRHPVCEIRGFDIAQSFEGELLFHNISIHGIIRVFVIMMSSSARLRRQVDIAVIVIAGEECGRDSLPTGNFFVSSIQLGLQPPSLAQFHRVKVAFVIQSCAFVDIILSVPVIGLEAFTEQIDIVVRHLVNIVKVILNLCLLLDILVVFDSMRKVERPWRR